MLHKNRISKCTSITTFKVFPKISFLILQRLGKVTLYEATCMYVCLHISSEITEPNSIKFCISPRSKHGTLKKKYLTDRNIFAKDVLIFIIETDTDTLRERRLEYLCSHVTTLTTTRNINEVRRPRKAFIKMHYVSTAKYIN